MIKLLIDAPPGWAAINRKTATRSFNLSERYLAFRDTVIAAVRQARVDGQLPQECPSWKRIGLGVSEYWPTQYRSDPLLRGLPRGDIDSPLKGVLDGLQKAEVYKDDAHITEMVVCKYLDAASPRVEVELWEVVE